MTPYNSEAEVELDGRTCTACGDQIELGFAITDDDGFTYCEDCWQP